MLVDVCEGEAQEMRVYFILTSLFGAMPEYSAVGEEGKVIFAPKKTVTLPRKSPVRFKNWWDSHP